MYVYEYINQVISETNPRSIRYMMPRFQDEKYRQWDMDVARQRHDVPRGWHLEYGKIIVSIQCGSFNYCDYYRRGENNFYCDHPYTTTAEVAIFENQYPGRWIDMPDGQQVGAWLPISEIDHIIKTLAEYAGHIVISEGI